VEGGFVMGGFMKAEQEARIYLNYIERLSSALSYKPNFTIHTQAMERHDLQRLKDAGLDAMAIQIEVMDPELFAEICPGKAQHMPYERWVECFHDAVDILGVGNVAGKLIPGVTLISPNGHKTWQEARDYHIEADNWLIKNGVVPAFYAMWWAPGSVYEDRSVVEKFPPTEYLLDTGLAHHEAMLEYGLYDKMNKFTYCGFDCATGPYVADIGMLSIAGDVGNWMANVVPEEANWLAQFIASLKSPAKTK
ncbi:MAG: hypothetical protein Q7O66_24020, partial [Dehalococcoidia bacterium]|nr:hypothetical protein [Dehalococcoidia bacterium]